MVRLLIYISQANVEVHPSCVWPLCSCSNGGLSWLTYTSNYCQAP